MGVLRLSCRPAGDGNPGLVVDVVLDEAGARRAASAQVEWTLDAQDREEVRWYLEDYLQYPVDPAPQIARRVEGRLQTLGAELFTGVFEANRDMTRLWDTVAGALPDTRVEVAAGADVGVPWEWLRDPVTDGALAVRAGAFVRTHPETAAPVRLPAQQAGALRVLLVICRPGGRDDVPFRSVASHLVRLSSGARQAFQLDVLRPPTFAALARALEEAKDAGQPYQVVHFDGHGTWLDAEAAAEANPAGGLSRTMFSLVSPARAGPHGFLVFEDPRGGGGQQLVDGPALGGVLAGAGVPVLVLNACRSAHADLATRPETVTRELDAHQRVRAYGSLAQEVMDAGVAGVVAMGYNVYVVTAARFIGEVYAALLRGRPLGEAVTAARRQLHADPVRELALAALPLQDWVVPVVYEAASLALLPAPAKTGDLRIDLDQDQAGAERAAVEGGLPGGPAAGFYGRDESLLALDRAFDASPVVLLHAWAGAGKTSTAAEFARWYAHTGGVAAVLFTSFEHHLTLAGLLDQVGQEFGAALGRAGVPWAALDESQRRDVALQVLRQVPALWVWDNVEPVTGFPAGTGSAWTAGEQHALRAFLDDLAGTRCKVLVTSRREERAWLGDLPARIVLPPMPMLERLELARAVAARQPGGQQLFLEVEDWRPLLEFTRGNPLTVTVLTRQAIRDHRTSSEQIEEFVAQLRAGAAQVTDDTAQGRAGSLAASLDYGFTHVFTRPERAILALLALFQGFVDVDVITALGRSSFPVPTAVGLTREAGIALLDRAAEAGLLTAHGEGYYDVHPAIPWYLHQLFAEHYGPPDGPAAIEAARAWVQATQDLGNYYQRQYTDGYAQIIAVLGAEEANLLQARRLALAHDWLDLIIGPMQGLRVLYQHTGRSIEWRRLVAELIPLFTDMATGGPRPGYGERWSILTHYRIDIALDARDWATAQQLQDIVIAWDRNQATAALDVPPAELTDRQRGQIQNLAVDLHELGEILRRQLDPECMQRYQEAMELCERIGARRFQATIALNLGHAYSDRTALRDLSQAEHWYQRRFELLDEHDTLGRARTIGELGNIAHERFLDAQEAGADEQQLLRHLNDSAEAYLEMLDMLPADAVDEHAIAHHSLGNAHADAGQLDTALGHFQQAIRYRERQDDRYGAGWIRARAALALADAGRVQDALLFAQAAFRDYEAVGAGAADEVAGVREFIAELEQRQPPQRPR
jgi:tetratricopeptide (TPR) repeat protein